MNNKTCAIDIGGTNARIALFDEKNKIIFKKSFPSNPQDPKETLDLLIKILNENQIENVGICLPGQADFDKGIITLALNLPAWLGFNFKEYILKNSNIKNIVFQNDANAMALAGHKYYQKGENDITQFFTISTGFGGGLIINNKIFRGFSDKAQEIAFIPASYNGNEKNRLSRGSAEYFDSGSGMVKRVKLNYKKDLSTKEIFEAYLNKNEYKEIINEAIEAMGNAISSIIAFINPNSIILGGLVVEHNEWFVDAIIKHVESVTLKQQFQVIEFLKNPYGDDLALYGIYFLAKDGLK